MSRAPWISATAFTVLLLFSGMIAGCSLPSKKEAKLYGAGEKATVGPLTYSVIDTQIAATLGDDPNNQRTPQNRFYIVQVSVSNSANRDVSIPGMTLVDDDGQAYQELPDGTGVPQWLGLLRKVSPAQTDEGSVIFDAPPKHYRLRLTEDGEDEVSIDIPMSFAHDEAPSLPEPAIPQPEGPAR